MVEFRTKYHYLVFKVLGRVSLDESSLQTL